MYLVVVQRLIYICTLITLKLTISYHLSSYAKITKCFFSPQHVIPPPSSPPTPPTLQLRKQANQCTADHLVALGEGRELEEALAGAADEGGALVRQVDELVEAEAVHEVVRQHRAVGVLGLAHHVLRARVVEK